MTGANSSSSIISLGKNEKSTTVLSPLLLVSRGFFIAPHKIVAAVYDRRPLNESNAATVIDCRYRNKIYV